ncbi:hypothetical protein NPIL_525741 [Nephila pilipes]|uniref:Uncharacterized protein n=1 Tax=Nephila pilipes TaxID=299642 RepID=A0A8X6TXP9_NEPPI|nr:hypothetical protein NPIL_525741 [Nephila pilipes]
MSRISYQKEQILDDSPYLNSRACGNLHRRRGEGLEIPARLCPTFCSVHNAPQVYKSPDKEVSRSSFKNVGPEGFLRVFLVVEDMAFPLALALFHTLVAP